MVFRGAPGKLPPMRLMTGLVPNRVSCGGGTVLVERLDQPGEKREIAIGGPGPVKSPYYDCARHGIELAAGGLYRASSAGRELVFKIAPDAQPGMAPLVARAMRL
jgi:hypothetical protein